MSIIILEKLFSVEVGKILSSYILKLFSTSAYIDLSNYKTPTKINAVLPRFPTRPVRPMRCTYSSMSLGKSKFMTCLTLEISSPRAATYWRQEGKSWIPKAQIKKTHIAIQPNMSLLQWQLRRDIGQSGTDVMLLLYLAECDHHGYWCKHVLRGTGIPPERQLPF